MEQNRFRSPVVWLAVLMQLVVVVGLFVPQLSDAVKMLGACVIECLTLFGILNNPTNPGGF